MVPRMCAAAPWVRVTCFTVSTGTTPTMAAPLAAASSSTLFMVSSSIKGRTASCTATSVVSASSASMPCHTDSCRWSPPRTTQTLPPGTSHSSRAATHSRSSGRTATTMSSTRAQPANFRTVCTRMGEPSSSMNCLRLVPAVSGEKRPIRVPRPAAGKITAIFMDLRFYRGSRLLGSNRLGGRIGTPRPVVRGLVARHRRVHALIVLAEDHLAGRGLEHAGHGDVDGLRNHLLGVIHHHHGAVIQVGHALVVLLAFLEHEHAHDLAR